MELYDVKRLPVGKIGINIFNINISAIKLIIDKLSSLIFFMIIQKITLSIIKVPMRPCSDKNS